jgi:hypothetical protein
LSDARERADQELAYGGVCPVCGEEFTDGFEHVEEGESIEGVRICITEKVEDSKDGECLMHLPEEVEER